MVGVGVCDGFVVACELDAFRLNYVHDLSWFGGLGLPVDWWF